MCDVVYALLVTRLEAHVRAERQVAAALVAGGAQDVTVPSIHEALVELEEALLAEPKVLDPERAELLDALGVRHD